jgi:hypothetical protein
MVTTVMPEGVIEVKRLHLPVPHCTTNFHVVRMPVFIDSLQM